MAGTNTPYIAKSAAPLVNPITTLVVFTQNPSPIATVAATQVLKSAYVKYNGYSQYGEGVSNNVDLIRIKVTAAGRATGGTTTNWTPSIQMSAPNAGIPSTTSTSNTTIATGTATAYNTATGNWLLAVELLWDPTSGQINGILSGYGGSGGSQTTTAATAITPQTGYTLTPTNSTQSYTTPVVIPASTGELILYFAAGGLFSASNAGNISYLDLFQVEVL
jgi:hypothetical protein